MLKLYWNEEIKDCDYCAINLICDSRIILINCSAGEGTYQIKDVNDEPEYKWVKATRYNLKIGSEVRMFQYEDTENRITAIGKNHALVEIDGRCEKIFEIESLRVKQVRTTEGV